MALTKSNGNMYPWVSHMHTHLRGECSHKCKYCYVQHGTAARTGYYSGPLRLDEKQLAVNYGSGKTIFIEHCQDLFANEVPQEYIKRVFAHCACFPSNEYILQTKNPSRLASYISDWPLPYSRLMTGATIETNRITNISNAPTPQDRARGMAHLYLRKTQGLRTFITIEPILSFDLEPFLDMIAMAQPDFVNIGADSKGTGLDEPHGEDVFLLVEQLRARGIEIRQKRNLDRLMTK